MKTLLLMILVSLAALPPPAQGLQCYTCVTSGNDMTCLSDPEHVVNGSPITDCKQGENICCTITRQEYLETPGVAQSFGRGCQENCMEDGFSENPDSTQVIYLTYCKTPKCNKGDGNVPLDDGGGGDDSNKDNVIKNIPGNVASLTTPLPLLMAAAALALAPGN
ncbi:uncharacterized protein [Cherax quadricarinatus]